MYPRLAWNSLVILPQPGGLELQSHLAQVSIRPSLPETVFIPGRFFSQSPYPLSLQPGRPTSSAASPGSLMASLENFLWFLLTVLPRVCQVHCGGVGKTMANVQTSVRGFFHASEALRKLRPSRAEVVSVHTHKEQRRRALSPSRRPRERLSARQTAKAPADRACSSSWPRPGPGPGPAPCPGLPRLRSCPRRLPGGASARWGGGWTSRSSGGEWACAPSGRAPALESRGL